MARGRPLKSEIRQNIMDILHYLKKGYGYEIYRIYTSVFPKCTIEVVYYHLKKGVTLDEFRVERVSQEKGDFSWGPIAEKTFYALGPNASPRISRRLENHISKLREKAEKKPGKRHARED